MYRPANNIAICANLTSSRRGLNKRCVVATQNGVFFGPCLVTNFPIKPILSRSRHDSAFGCINSTSDEEISFN